MMFMERLDSQLPPNPGKPELRDCELRNLGIDGMLPILIPEFLNYLSVLKASVFINIFCEKNTNFTTKGLITICEVEWKPN
jgi:hypothetical protein